MGNSCGTYLSIQEKKKFSKPINFQSTNQANIQFTEEYDNPKRNILSSNFLAEDHYSPNDLQTITIKQQKSTQAASSRRYSLIKIDSIQLDKQIDPCSGIDDEIKQSFHPKKKQKRATFSHPIDIQQLNKKTLFRQTKNYIMSDKHLYQPMEIRTEKFIDVKYKNIQTFYSFLQKIGQGSFGNVHKALCLRTKQIRAIKILKKSKQKRKNDHHPQRNLQQLNILRTLDHPNIIKLFEVYFYNQYFYLVTQYCEGGSILSYLKQNKNYSENIVKTIVKQLLSALSYLHSLKIAHRDIKLENIVFIKQINSQSKTQDVQIKLIDFGQSFRLKYSHNNKDSREIGTITYMAPQVIEGLYSQKCDIWSCGVILWILISGKNPFKRNSKIQTFNCIKCKQLQFRDIIWEQVPQSLKKLLIQMLQRNSLRRISAKQALKSSWFTENGQSLNAQKMKEVVKKLYHYYRGNNLISVIQSYLTFLKITQQQRIEVTKLFKKIDKDNSGTIDICQLKQAFIIYTGQQNNDEIEYVLRKIDKNKSRKIDLNQFITAFYGHKKLFCQHENSLELAFAYFDNDQNGYIDIKELKDILTGCDQKQINKILKEIDQNGDQKISKEQFIRYIKQERYL